MRLSVMVPLLLTVFSHRPRNLLERPRRRFPTPCRPRSMMSAPPPPMPGRPLSRTLQSMILIPGVNEMPRPASHVQPLEPPGRVDRDAVTRERLDRSGLRRCDSAVVLNDEGRCGGSPDHGDANCRGGAALAERARSDTETVEDGARRRVERVLRFRYHGESRMDPVPISRWFPPGTWYKGLGVRTHRKRYGRRRRGTAASIDHRVHAPVSPRPPSKQAGPRRAAHAPAPTRSTRRHDASRARTGGFCPPVPLREQPL